MWSRLMLKGCCNSSQKKQKVKIEIKTKTNYSFLSFALVILSQLMNEKIPLPYFPLQCRAKGGEREIQPFHCNTVCHMSVVFPSPPTEMRCRRSYLTVPVTCNQRHFSSSGRDEMSVILSNNFHHLQLVLCWQHHLQYVINVVFPSSARMRHQRSCPTVAITCAGNIVCHVICVILPSPLTAV
uniref:Uncharacterized protein n=1 Tax=Nelumbo nucifera TaxID=4432 RepID=A0A822XS04_NELNU|nr:TPA_asm: hypothetical protein HUJ06_023322 [Nelumbo nucifera]